MRIIVQKFGGTSLSTQPARLRVADHILEAHKNGTSVVVVVSAMGRSPDPYATDTLLQLLRKESNPKQKDLLMSCGEILSVAVMADLLESRGVTTETLVLHQIGLITDGMHGDAEILEIDVAPILARLEKGAVVVIPGFQGTTLDRQVTTLGRGGSDTTATALGAALKAELVEIYTDVDGVLSADPRILPDARTISEITYEEIGEMAYLGAKVVHPKAVSFAMESKIRLRVRSTFTDHPGTLISDHKASFKHWVTGVTNIPKMTYVSINLENEKELPLAQTKVFKAFANDGISLDFITVSQRSIDFILRDNYVSKAENVLASFPWKTRLEPGFAKVSVVGAGMRGRPGVMSRVVETLYNAGIPLYHSTDSHITIACLVKESDMAAAVRALHSAFFRDLSAVADKSASLLKQKGTHWLENESWPTSED